MEQNGAQPKLILPMRAKSVKELQHVDAKSRPETASLSRPAREIEAIGKQQGEALGKERTHTVPGFVPPMLAKRVEKLPEGRNWSYELKLDGYRIEVIKDDQNVRLLSRRGNDFTRKFARVTTAASKIKAETAVVDGEVVVVDAQGKPSFQVLQNRASLPRGYQMVYYAFDLLFLNGRDVKHEPLSTRREMLEPIIKGSGILFSPELNGSASEVMAAIRKHGLEGIVAKRKDSIYEPDQRSGAWVKLPFKPRQEFVIGGYRPLGRSLELLLVGVYDKGKFVFSGKVRGGLNPGIRAGLIKLLTPLIVSACPFTNLPNSKKGHWGEGVTAEDMKEYIWVKPQIVAEVKFTEWTHGDVLRHPEFVAFREDKDPLHVIREAET